MAKLRIKNFGPIKGGLEENDGWIDISKVTIFIGNQGSGKSTIAKLFSTFAWIEKALVRGDYEQKWFERKNRLENQFLSYHRLENYLEKGNTNQSEIEYQGDAYSIKYSQHQLHIHEVKNKTYHLPQIMYVPAERNFISYVRNPKELKLSSDSLKEFLTEFDNAKANMKGPEKLPINNVELEYDKLNDIINIRDTKYKLRLTDASSGFQSLVPLFLVSSYLSKSVQNIAENKNNTMSTEETQRFKKDVSSIFENSNLTEEQKRVAISALSSKFNKTAFVNIVEEPEQNLYPSAQWELLQSLLACNNLTKANSLLITTHSPYIVNYMSLAVQAHNLVTKINMTATPEISRQKVQNIINLDALIDGKDLTIYQLDGNTGSIKKLTTFEGVPSDQNYLNKFLMSGNQLFDSLLEIEEGI